MTGPRQRCYYPPGPRKTLRAGRIASDPRVAGGTPVVAGTRVPVDIVVGGLAAGMTVEEVCDEYRLTPPQVRAALAYAAGVVAEERIVSLPAR